MRTGGKREEREEDKRKEMRRSCEVQLLSDLAALGATELVDDFIEGPRLR